MSRAAYDPRKLLLAAWLLAALGETVAEPADNGFTGQEWSFPLRPEWITPSVTCDGREAAIERSGPDGGILTWKVRAGGNEVATLRIDGRSQTRLTESLSASGDGTFGFGLFMTVPKRARILDLDCTEADERTPALEKFYPYNWNLRLERRPLRSEGWMNVTDHARVDLEIPGFESAGVYYAKESWRLAQLTFEGVPGGVRVGLTHNREINEGHDATSTAFALAKGGTETMSLLAAPSMRELLVARFGRPNPVTGRLTFVYHRGWMSDDPRANLTPELYKNIAEKRQGHFDMVHVRSWQPDASIAAAFSARGIAAYYYWMPGAVRRTTRNAIPPVPDPSWLLRDTKGTLYTAPRVDVPERPASWPLLNIRKPEVRRWLIERQEAAIRAGYQGVFLDSPYYFAGSDGCVGGKDPGATDSWAYARNLLYKETKEAITRINPDARLAVLGNMFVDFQFLADWVYNENYANSWVGNDDNPYERILDNDWTHPKEWDRTYRQYMQGAYMLGQKGENPLVVGSWLNWGRAPLDSWFTENNQITSINGSYAPCSEALACALRAVSEYARSPRGTVIESTSPRSATIRTYGPSVISAPKPVTLRLSARSPMLNLATSAITVGATQTLAANDRYIIAERHEDDHWSWSGYGFAYVDRRNYICGDAYFLERPSGDGSGNLKLVVQTSPGPLAPGTPAAHNGAFRAHTLTFHWEKAPRTVRISGTLGLRTETRPSADSGVFTVALPAKPDFGTYVIDLAFAPP